MAEQEPNFLEEIRDAANKAGRPLSDRALAYLASLPSTVSASLVPIEDGLYTTRPSQQQWVVYFNDSPELAVSVLENRAGPQAPISTSERK